MISMAQRFSPLLTGRIGLQWVVAIGVLGSRQGCIGSINTGSRSQNELANLLAVAELQQGTCPRDIGIHIHPWILHRLAHTGPGCQIGRAHVCTPVTSLSRLPSSAWKQTV